MHSEIRKKEKLLKTIFILDTSKQVLWQTVKTQLNCHIRWHFIRVCTVCSDKVNLRDRNIHPFIEILIDDTKWTIPYFLGQYVRIIHQNEED